MRRGEFASIMRWTPCMRLSKLPTVRMGLSQVADGRADRGASSTFLVLGARVPVV